MFYHFKGTITGEDYQRILGQMTKRMMLVFSGIMLIFLVINLFMSKGQWLWPVVSALLVLVLGNLLDSLYRYFNITLSSAGIWASFMC